MSKEDWILNKEERRKIRVSLWPETWPVDKEGELALVEKILQGKLHAQNRKTIEKMLEWDNKGCPHWQANHSVFRTPSRCLQCRKELLE